jgi:signal peptidase complex subunit 3
MCEVSSETPPPTCGNTKQLFVSLAAEYETKINKVNQVSIWDRVVESKEDAVLRLPYVRNKYKLVDQGSNLRGLAVNLTLEWNIMPITGSMSVGRRTFTGFILPKEYLAADPSMGNPHTGGRGGMRYMT